MPFVIRPVNRERLAPRVGRVGHRDRRDPDGRVTGDEPDPIGSRHIVRAENDRDREGRSAREAASRDHRFVVLATQKSIDRRQRARAEHEDVRQLALTDLELRQAPRLSPELQQLLPRGKSLERRARQMAEPLQPVEHLRHRLGEALDRRIADHLRMERFLVGIAHAGEVGDLAGDGLAVKAFGVPLDQRVKRRPDEHLDETLAHTSPPKPQRCLMARSSVPKRLSIATPMAKITIIKASSCSASARSRANCSCWPSDAWWLTMTSSSPAIRLRHAKAQPCFRPPTKEGNAAGRITCLYKPRPFAPITCPTRTSSGCTSSTPLRSPAAMAGAAPRMTTNVMAPSPGWNRRMASGNHAIEGIDCRPKIAEPTALRRSDTRATRIPTALPMATAMA